MGLSESVPVREQQPVRRRERRYENATSLEEKFDAFKVSEDEQSWTVVNDHGKFVSWRPS